MNINNLTCKKNIHEMLPKSLLKEVNNIDNNEISQIREEDISDVIILEQQEVDVTNRGITVEQSKIDQCKKYMEIKNIPEDEREEYLKVLNDSKLLEVTE